MPDWLTIESVTEYDTPWYTGGYDLVEHPDSTTKKYYWAELPPAVVIVPRHADKIVFVEQYRPTVRETFLELPAGIVEPDETYPDAAARELTEETGYTAGRTSLLAEYWVATGVLRHRRGVVYADDLTPGTPDRDQSEFLTVTTHPVTDAITKARTAPANDATIEGLLLAAADGHLPLTTT